jgi:heat shock protein HslJ
MLRAAFRGRHHDCQSELPMFRSWVLPHRPAGWLLALVIIAMSAPSLAAERSFPFDSELMLDARPMKGSKRVPVIGIGRNGEATIDLWCNSIEGQIVVIDSTISVMTGAKTDRQCDSARMLGDADLLAALQQATSWSRAGDVVTLRGAKTLRFRQPTN